MSASKLRKSVVDDDFESFRKGTPKDLDDGDAMMDEIYGWTDLVPAINSEFDVVRDAAEEFGLYDD